MDETGLEHEVQPTGMHSQFVAWGHHPTMQSSPPSVSRLQEFSRESHLKTASFHVPFLWWLKFVRDIGMFPENTRTFSWRSFSRNQNNAPNHPLVGS